MWASITIIYGTESYLAPLTLKLIMIMGIHTGHPSVGMLSTFQPTGIHKELQGILTCSEFKAFQKNILDQ